MDPNQWMLATWRSMVRHWHVANISWLGSIRVNRTFLIHIFHPPRRPMSIQTQLFWTTALIPILQVTVGCISIYNYAVYDNTEPNTTVYIVLHSLIIGIAATLAIACRMFIRKGAQRFMNGLHIEAITLGIIGSAVDIAAVSQYRTLQNHLNRERWPCESRIVRSITWNNAEMLNIVLMFVSISLLCVHAVVNHRQQ